MPSSCLLLPTGMPPAPRHRYYEHKFRKQTDLNSAAAAVFGGSGSLSAGPVGFLSASLAGFLSADLAGFLSAGFAGFSEPTAAASTLSGNSVRNCVEFRNLG